MADSDNYALPSKLRTEILINESMNLDLRHGIDYEFYRVKPSYSHGLRYNTSLVLAFKGDREGIKERIFYRRLSLSYVAKGKEVPVFKISEPYVYLHQILHLINEHYGTALEMDELVDDRFVVNSALSYECRVSDHSLAWDSGSLPFKLDPLTVLLSDALPVWRLDGLTPPQSRVIAL